MIILKKNYMPIANDWGYVRDFTIFKPTWYHWTAVELMSRQYIMPQQARHGTRICLILISLKAAPFLTTSIVDHIIVGLFCCDIVFWQLNAQTSMHHRKEKSFLLSFYWSRLMNINSKPYFEITKLNWSFFVQIWQIKLIVII